MFKLVVAILALGVSARHYFQEHPKQEHIVYPHQIHPHCYDAPKQVHPYQANPHCFRDYSNNNNNNKQPLIYDPSHFAPLDPPTPSPAARHCDVVVVGGGGGGANTAVFLKDKGKDVCLIEKSDHLGGACNTIYVPGDVPLDWIDIGVAAYINTTWCNANGFGQFMIDMVAYVSRFVPIIPFPAIGTPPSFYAEPIQQIGVLPYPPLNFTPADAAQLGNDLNALYPFLSNSTWPDVIPAELIQSYQSYFNTQVGIRRFTPMLVNFVLTGGFGPIADLPAVYPLRELPIYLRATNEGGILFTPFEGCQALYNGIAAYLQPTGSPTQNVYYNSTITKITRPGVSSPGVSTVHFTSNGQSQLIIANKVIIAIPQTLFNLNLIGMDLNAEEVAAFNRVIINPGFFALELQGVLPYPAVDMMNFSNVVGYQEPTYPTIATLYPGFASIGAPVLAGLATGNITYNQMLAIVQANITQMKTMSPAPLDLTLLQMIQHTDYFPHFPQSALATSPWKRIYDLQGKRNTFWLGALPTFADTTLIVDYAYRIVNQNF